MFLNTIRSGDQYVKVIGNYEKYVNRSKQENPNITYEKVLITYFQDLHETGITNGLTEEEEGNGANQVTEMTKQKASSLYGILSMIKTFYKMSQNIDIGMQVPIIPKLLKSWQQMETKKQSKTFKYEDIMEFLSWPPTPETLVQQVNALLSISGLLRVHESLSLTFSSIVRHETSYTVEFFRGKQRQGNRKTNDFVIVDQRSIELLDIYIKLFSENSKKLHDNRFFRKLGLNKGNGNIKSTDCVIGKNTLATWPKAVATALSLPDPKEYTSHAYRRTGATWLANGGGSSFQIKLAGGWKSLTVAEHYVENSTVQKDDVANSLFRTAAQNKSSVEKLRTVDQTMRTIEQQPNITLHIDLSNSSGQHNVSIGEEFFRITCPKRFMTNESTSEQPSKIHRTALANVEQDQLPFPKPSTKNLPKSPVQNNLTQLLYETKQIESPNYENMGDQDFDYDWIRNLGSQDSAGSNESFMKLI